MATRNEKNEPAAAPPAEEGPRSFAHFMHMLADGRASADLSNELQELLVDMGVESSRRDVSVVGELSIKFKFKVDPAGVVSITHEVRSKRPTRPTAPGVMWLTAGGNLSTTNPRQLALGLREVPRPSAATAPAKEV